MLRINIGVLVLLVDLIVAVIVGVDSRRRGRKSPAFDAVLAFAIPIVGVLLYASGVKVLGTPDLGQVPEEARDLETAAAASHGGGLQAPPPLVRAPEPEPAPKASLMAELTAEVRRLQDELATVTRERDLLRAAADRRN